MLKFTERPKHQESLQKIKAFPEGNKLFAGDFRANLDETSADMVQFIKSGTGNGLSNVNLRQSMRTFKAGLSSSYDVMVGQSIKEKYLMCQVSIKMLKHYTIPNSSLHNPKIYSSKGYRTTCQR